MMMMGPYYQEIVNTNIILSNTVRFSQITPSKKGKAWPLPRVIP